MSLASIATAAPFAQGGSAATKHKVFANITGDEMGMLKEYGLLPE
ncbi:MAG: hypothetical protein ACYDCO_04965 [Armatimonadota bacterium]